MCLNKNKVFTVESCITVGLMCVDLEKLILHNKHIKGE